MCVRERPSTKPRFSNRINFRLARDALPIAPASKISQIELKVCRDQDGSRRGKQTANSYPLGVQRVVLGLLFLAIGATKLTGTGGTVPYFAAIGWGQWFRYLTGFLDVHRSCVAFCAAVDLLRSLDHHLHRGNGKFNRPLQASAATSAAARVHIVGRHVGPASTAASNSLGRRAIGQVPVTGHKRHR
jgi:hypothetical protein